MVVQNCWSTSRSVASSACSSLRKKHPNSCAVVTFTLAYYSRISNLCMGARRVAYELWVALVDVRGHVEALNELGHDEVRAAEAEAAEEQRVDAPHCQRCLRQPHQDLIERARAIPAPQK